MRILVTGGAGFIGSNLIARLCEAGAHEIVVLDDESVGSRDALDRFDIKFVHGKIEDNRALDSVLERVEAVVHLAAETQVIASIENPQAGFNTNVAGTFQLLETMRQKNITRFVNASTGGAIIGSAEPPVSEDMPASPLSPYGASKLAVEGYCSAYAASYGMQCASLRFSNVYGPRSWHKGSVVAHFIKQIMRGEPLTIYGDGSQTRDYVHVRDIADGIAAALTSDASGPVQLGTGEGTPLSGIVAILREISGEDFAVEHAPFRDGEIVHSWCDISHARDVLGYAPQIGLAEGIDETWHWFQDNRAALSL